MKMRLSITLKLSLVWFVLAGMVLGRYTEPAFLIIATLFIMLQLNKVYVSTSCLFVGTLFSFIHCQWLCIMAMILENYFSRLCYCLLVCFVIIRFSVLSDTCF